jgi:quercetin dioxygenase-like cupin family protein
MSVEVEFEAALRAEGFEEIAVRERGETPTNAMHTHPFDARILVLEGGFGLTVEGSDLVLYGPGESFSVPSGTVHQETFPAGGAKWMFGTRMVG